MKNLPGESARASLKRGAPGPRVPRPLRHLPGESARASLKRSTASCRHPHAASHLPGESARASLKQGWASSLTTLTGPSPGRIGPGLIEA